LPESGGRLAFRGFRVGLTLRLHLLRDRQRVWKRAVSVSGCCGVSAGITLVFATTTLG